MDSQSSPQKSKSNRTLLLVIGAGGFLLLACVAVVAFFGGMFVVNRRVTSTTIVQNLPMIIQETTTPQANIGQATSTPPQAPEMETATPVSAVASPTPMPPAAEVSGSAAEPPDAQSALLAETRGWVEVQGANGAWVTASNGTILKARQSLRTGLMSSAVLVFYDGSRVSLGPESEIFLDTLDASRSGPRLIRLNQIAGESDHQVMASSDAASTYEVITPDGTGTAQGTAFHVAVLKTRLVRFDADEGMVTVTKGEKTVQIVAGQSTYTIPSAPPSPPLYWLSGRGKVERTEDRWKIGGVIFINDGHTEVVGGPQVGDWVSYDALVLLDSSRLLTRVSLLRRAPENRFTYTGKVVSIGDTQWTVADRDIQTGAAPDVDPGIQAGNLVEVEGGIAEDGALVAERISLLTDQPGLPFVFSGIVTEISENRWLIAGIPINADAKTTTGSGIVVGDQVEVRGWTLADGTWQAQEIQRSGGDVHRVAVSGTVQNLSPLNVSGARFATDEDTQFDPTVKVGDRVRVEGLVLADGSWLAQDVQPLDVVETPGFQFFGLVTSLSPWTVDSLPLPVDGNTEFDEGIAAGELVRVQGVISQDGKSSVQKVQRLERKRGCLTETSVIYKWEADTFEVLDWHWGKFKRQGNLKISGDVMLATLVSFSGCIRTDGTFNITQVTGIYQLNSVPERIAPEEVHQ